MYNNGDYQEYQDDYSDLGSVATDRLKTSNLTLRKNPYNTNHPAVERGDDFIPNNFGLPLRKRTHQI